MPTITVTKIQARRSKTAAYRPASSGAGSLSDAEFFFNLTDGQMRIGGITTDIPLFVASTAEANAGTANKIITPPALQGALASYTAALAVVVDGGQEG